MVLFCLKKAHWQARTEIMIFEKKLLKHWRNLQSSRLDVFLLREAGFWGNFVERYLHFPVGVIASLKSRTEYRILLQC